MHCGPELFLDSEGPGSRNAMAPKRKPRLLPLLPDECWLKVFAFLEASELSGCASGLCAGALALSSQPQLWISLLHVDFCASFAQRALLRTWLAMHQNFHPRQLYIYKRREHLLDLDIARTELQQRGEQAREQDRKQRRLRTLNFVLVRVTHLLLCACMLATSILLWLRIDGVVGWSFYFIFTPFFAFEVFVFVSATVAMAIYCLRGKAGWTFYWNRLCAGGRWRLALQLPSFHLAIRRLLAHVDLLHLQPGKAAVLFCRLCRIVCAPLVT